MLPRSTPDRATGPGSGSAESTDGPVVLLVDDQPIVAATVRRALTAEADIRFHSCEKARDGPALAAALRPTVILQDLVMPDADGLEMIERYRASEITRSTPIVVLSSEEDPKTKAEAFRRGANDYLVKPPERVELIARVRYHSRAFRLLQRAEALHEAEKQRLVADRQAAALRARDTLIFAIAKLAESRDTDTGEHLDRIAAYCRVLAEQLRATRPELTDGWIRNLQLASSLHDIGKIGIPDRVLLKPGRLDSDERAIIERHPRLGAEALDAILVRNGQDELLRMARNIAAAHHERWDGTGYPQRLAGAAIPLEARIVSVADVYDALTSSRVYKPALSHEEALGLIAGGRGSQFDPEVVDALLRCEIVFRHAGVLLHEDGDGRATDGGRSDTGPSAPSTGDARSGNPPGPDGLPTERVSR